jgi:hypothetical protein
MGLSGNINGTKTTRGYTRGIEDRFVESFEIIEHCEKVEIKRWAGPELQDMRATFSKAIRVLETT